MRGRYWTTWPFLCLLACLFVLSVTGPRAWQEATRRRLAELETKAPHVLARPGGHPPAASEKRAPAVRETPAPEEDRDARAHANKPVSIPEALEDEQIPEGAESIDAPAEPDMAISFPVEKPAVPQPAESPDTGTQARQTADDPAAQPAFWGAWPEPESLLERLDELSWDCSTGIWAREVSLQLRRLGQSVAERSDTAMLILDRLDYLAAQADPLAESLQRTVDPLVGKVRRAQHALTRRLEVWRRVMMAGGPESGPAPKVDAQRLARALGRIRAMLGDFEEGKPWRAYLELDALQQLAEGAAYDDDAARQIARAVVKRMTRPGLTAPQRAFLAQAPMVELNDTLCDWLYGTADLAAVLRHVEHVERCASASEGRLLADDCRRLAASPVAEHRALADLLEFHYRNANVRVALSEDFLTRLMPEREPQCEYVNDEVMGRPVRGRSVTSANVGVKLIPDPHRLRLALQVEGLVSALTTSTAGPATFYNDSESIYRARKEIELTVQGLRLGPAEVEVSNQVCLRDVETQFDVIPLIGPLAKHVARSQHEQSRSEMTREVEWKVATRAKAQIDTEAEARLGRLSQRLRGRVMAPLEALSLGPTMISAQTSAARMTMRMRLSSDDQLGGWTPRPQAPSDCLASFQIHESALNNMIEKLELDGGTFTVAEVRQRIARRFNRPELLKVSSPNDDVVIRFADTDAARIRCQDGSVVVTLAIASLRSGEHRWKHFQVRAFYRPQINGRTAALVRDGVIRLTGQRLTTGAQIALRGIFSNTFSKEGSWSLMPPMLRDKRKMADIGVSQCVIEDGWLGLAYGPLGRAGR